MERKICVLGSTGSVGRQALEVIREKKFRLVGICADRNINLLENQIREFKPDYCAVRDADSARELKLKVGDTGTKILSGEDGICEMVTEVKADMVLNSILGSCGIKPTLCAIEAKTDIAMANKEPIVAAGEIILQKARENNVKIIPVDSEHSAIFQCITTGFNSRRFVDRLVLTASGGPFFNRNINELKNVKPEEAIAHPTWNMGKKISVDSATLLNKGLELIEAVRLFDIGEESIDITVHRQSIVHSMVTFKDGSTLAQMGHPDMRHCIQFALTYPERTEGLTKPLDFKESFKLTFEPADEKTFSLLKTARYAAKAGGTFPTVLNAANEAAVALFLDGKIGFTDIFDIVDRAVINHKEINCAGIDDILELDFEVKRKTLSLC